MAFIPKISITDIPKDASSMKITDITGTSPTDATGYGQAAYLPLNNTIWTKQVYKQFLGKTPEGLSFTDVGDKNAVSATLLTDLADGVYLISEYFYVLRTPGTGSVPTYTISVDLKTLTNTSATPFKDPLGFFEGAYGIIKSATPDFLVSAISIIDSVNTSTLVLKSGLTGATTNSPFYIVYKANKYVLVTSAGEGKLISDIGDVNISELGCGLGCDKEISDDLMRRVLLKTSASIAFACGNYTKAHNAAILLAQSKSYTQPCSNCG